MVDRNMPEEFWHAIGSDQRYTPSSPSRWTGHNEERAYAAGLRDAMRIFEKHAWQSRHAHHVGTNVKNGVVKALEEMHRRARSFNG